MDTNNNIDNATLSHSDDLLSKNNSIQLTDIPLPNEWVLYLYDKQLFKKWQIDQIIKQNRTRNCVG